jgi:hypothetical protein
MSPALTPLVALDANILFPIALCDTLMRAARAGLYVSYWNEAILNEMERNLVKHDRATQEKARRRRSNMQGAFPRATVQGYEMRISTMTNDPKDRHVLATAVHIRAPTIVRAICGIFRPMRSHYTASTRLSGLSLSRPVD